MSTGSSVVEDTWVDVRDDVHSDGNQTPAARETILTQSESAGAHADAPVDSAHAAPAHLDSSDDEGEGEKSLTGPEAQAAVASSGQAVPKSGSGTFASPLASADTAQQPPVDMAWSRAEYQMDDIRFAEKPAPTLPTRPVKTQLTLLFAGQPETGRTTTGRNLFAALAQDADFKLTDTTGLTWDDFKRDTEPFTTRIACRDSDQPLNVSYTVIETPGLFARSGGIGAMYDCIIDRQAAFAAQERETARGREAVADRRVDAVLYFLPTNARVAELDLRAMKRLAACVPVVPIMCKADCLEEVEVQQRKAEMARLIAEGLPVFAFPEDALAQSYCPEHSLSGALSDSSPRAPAQAPAPFQLPFTIVTGGEPDETVHDYWFVRKYRWGACEAYCTSNSDLRILRQLVLENGYWALKDAADKLFRERCASTADNGSVPAAAAPLSAPTSAGASASASATSSLTRDALGALDRAARPYTMAQAFARTCVRPADGALNLRGCKPPTRRVPAGTQTNTLMTAADDDGSASKQTAGSSAQAVASAASAHTTSTGGSVATDTFDESNFVPVVVRQVRKSNERKTYRLTLQAQGSEKVLCLRVGEQEGSSLAHAFTDNQVVRPTAYDTFATMLTGLGCRVRRVVITKCERTLFYARVHAVHEATGAVVDADARPSDAINLAMRQHAPVLVCQDVIDKYAKIE